MGHPAPFNLKLMGVGNENWGPQYIERNKLFTKAIKDKYPNIKLVNSSGTDQSGERFDYLNGELRKMNADIIDEHYYRDAKCFRQNARRYDSYDPKSSKVFAGEYAAQSKGIASIDNKNNWLCAMSEAAFMTGLERNAGVVYMASYAPLFAHVDGWQWTPDLIWMDNLRSYGTPNYYVQKLFSLNKGSQVVPILLNNDVVAGQDSLFATASIDHKTNELLIKVVNTSDKDVTRQFVFEGVKKLDSKGMITILKSNDLSKVNSLDDPKSLSPTETALAVTGKKMDILLPAYSMQVIKVKIIN
jgi:alpha-L-arabinofuranosidase